MTTFE